MVSTDWDGPFTETEAYFELCESGFDALAEGRLEDAMEVAQSLEDERASVGFELRAHVQLQGGDVRLAILALQEGTRRAKHNWVLWQLLGNCYSDLEQFDQADAAYESAARCENADPDAVALNRAIMASRREGPEAALAILDAHEPEHLAQRFAALASELLREVGRTKDALARAKVALDQAKDDQDDARPVLLVQCSHALREMGRTKEARAAAETAHSLERGHPDALYALRLLDGEKRGEHVALRLLCRGVIPAMDGEPARGFLTNYYAVALDADDALRRARALEPALLRDSLVVEECEPTDGEADAPPGIYGMSGFAFFELDGPS